MNVTNAVRLARTIASLKAEKPENVNAESIKKINTSIKTATSEFNNLFPTDATERVDFLNILSVTLWGDARMEKSRLMAGLVMLHNKDVNQTTKIEAEKEGNFICYALIERDLSIAEEGVYAMAMRVLAEMPYVFGEAFRSNQALKTAILEKTTLAAQAAQAAQERLAMLGAMAEMVKAHTELQAVAVTVGQFGEVPKGMAQELESSQFIIDRFKSRLAV